MPGKVHEQAAFLLAGGANEIAHFQTTLWTTVLVAGDQSSPNYEAALAKLCQTYWQPVYVYIRKRTPSMELAQDLTQGFFTRFLSKNHVAQAQRERGRFRSFLLTSVQNYLRDEHDRATSLKRGSGQCPLSLEVALVEEENDPADTSDPASAFEKRWACTLLVNVMHRLAQEYQDTGRGRLFDQLQPHLWGDADRVPYDQLSTQLEMSVVSLRVTVHRMRQRYREILREEIAQTVSSPEDIESEIRYLLRVVSSR